jgi:tripartite-type tricarboxylate transporter receptor subunit TctC
MKRLHVFATVVFSAAFACMSCAQDFPVRPVRIVVPSTPGGALDVAARAIAPALTDKWKQQIVIDNRAGAGGIIGTEIVARSAPDGHTLLVVTTGFVTNPFIYRKLPYSTPGDFTPITILGTTPNVLVAHPSVPVRSVRELINLARDKPGQIIFGSSGVGSGGHLSMELMKKMAHIEFVHVPYKGAGAAVAALVAGEAQISITSTGAAIPQIRAGRLRALAVTGATRSETLPDVPTVAESGLPGYAVAGWYAVFGPGGMNKRLTARIYGDLLEILQRPDMTVLMRKLGFEPDAIAPDALAKRVANDLATWSAVIKDAGIHAD